jgi:DNA-binding SARP family transcriptional activator
MVGRTKVAQLNRLGQGDKSRIGALGVGKPIDGRSAPAQAAESPFAEPGKGVGRRDTWPGMFEHFPYGLLLADESGDIRYINRTARQMLLGCGAWDAETPLRCCDLICSRFRPLLGDVCMTRRALGAKAQLPEVRVDIEADRNIAAWVSVAALKGSPSQTLFHLRPGRAGDRRRRSDTEFASRNHREGPRPLQITTLGSLRVEAGGHPIDAKFLGGRTGQLLKYLLCERGRLVCSDQISEALWPDAGLSTGRSRLRYNVHVLRQQLEPERSHRGPSRHIVGRQGGYEFDTACAWIDADQFEQEACAGLAEARQGVSEAAAVHLEGAMLLYRGPFLADDPNLAWAGEERERLRELAGSALVARVEMDLGQGRLEIAAKNARRLVEMEPFDRAAQRLMIGICLKRGRRSEALRRYAQYRKRIQSSFGEDPDFDLLEIEREFSG